MDIRIKGDMDGIEAAEEIRNKFGIPVIFSTACLDGERIERAMIKMPFGYVLMQVIPTFLSPGKKTAVVRYDKNGGTTETRQEIGRLEFEPIGLSRI